MTIFVPISLQSKVEISKELVSIAQLSDEPLSISDADILASPLASNCTAISWVITVGAILSSTVTTAVDELEFPLVSCYG